MMVFSRGVIEQPSSSGEWVSGKSSKTSSWGNAFLFTVLSLMRTMATKLHNGIINVRGNNTAGAIRSDTRSC